MNKFDEFNEGDASNDEDTVIISTEFDNFYPSFDVPVVAELAAQAFIRSGLTLEVDNRELSLYISICYEREDLETWGLGDVTHTRVSRRGRRPGITTPEISSRSANMLNQNLLPPCGSRQRRRSS